MDTNDTVGKVGQPDGLVKVVSAEELAKKMAEREQTIQDNIKASAILPDFLIKAKDPTQDFSCGRDFVLTTARNAVMKDRNKSYGDPEDNFQNIANLWNAYFTAQGKHVQVKNYDVAQLMILVNTARLATNPTYLDGLVDQAGYASCGGDCVIHWNPQAATKG